MVAKALVNIEDRMRKQSSDYKFRAKTIFMEKPKRVPDMSVKVVDQYGFLHRHGNADMPELRNHIIDDLKKEPISPLKKKKGTLELSVFESDLTGPGIKTNPKQTIHEFAVDNRNTFATTNFLKHLGHQLKFK